MAYQHVHRTRRDAPRTHSDDLRSGVRGTNAGSDLLRDVDQQRDLLYLRWNSADDAFFGGDAEFTVSYHQFREEENRVRGSGVRRIQGVDVDQLGFLGNSSWAVSNSRRWSAASTSISKTSTRAGPDYTHTDGSINQVRPRGPVADDSTYDQVGVYGQVEFEPDDAWLLTLGARYNYAAAKSDKVDPSGGNTFPPLDDNWDALVGSFHTMYSASENTRIFGSIAQSFRAPNLSDLTRFDSALSGDVEIPATNLDPERFVTFELGARYDNGLRRAAITGFYTDVKDLIQRTPTGNIVGGESR